MKKPAKTGGWPHDGIDLSDLHNHIHANKEKPAPIKPVPVINECATCHRKDTLRLADGDERNRREWLCECCGSVANDRDRLMYHYILEPGAMACITPTVRSLLVKSAYALFQISQGDADALENAGSSARRLIRMIELGGPSEH